MQVIIFSTGEELLHGRSQDTNGPHIARVLSAHGFSPKRLEMLGDDPVQLRKQIRRASNECELIILTGGLGPTADDRTRKAVASAAERRLITEDKALQHVEDVLSKHGVKLTESHRQQARFPRGSETFANDRGTAYGFACPLGGATLIAMPGVPDEMRDMFHNKVLPHLLQKHQAHTKHRRINLFGLPESDVDRRISDMMNEERNPSVGITVDHSVVSICLRAHGSDTTEVERRLDEDEEELQKRFGEAIFGADDMSLAGAVSDLLAKNEMTIAFAESCTGGQIGSMLVDVPGVSRLFLLDVVAYSNDAKVHQLCVPAEQIESHGAVSAEVAESMARGVCKACDADMGISTTGIAGPTGGRPGKPVGLVYFGVCLEGETCSRRLNFKGNRQRVKDRAARHALNFARLALLHKSRQK